MEDNFPRLYSLSTIGIKQHFNCDYRFHPLRTDFSGESGSGKSMIADMIQLVLVGSGVYKSSTESNKSRDPKGMVIESKGKQNGRGYIILNIEVYYNKFITIGAYLESSHNQVQPFIIQGGYDWDSTLTPMLRPIYYQDLLINSKVESIEGLQDKLDNVSLKVLQRKKYHQLLYENSILAFDLNQDKRTLESYASILRSFSRGKGFQKDSESLKKFLFGDDDQNKLKQKFQEEVKAINNDFLEHERYKKEIELINNKQKLIEDVSDLNKKRKELQLAYLTDKNAFWNKMLEQATKKHELADNIFTEALIQNKYLEIRELELQIEEIKLSCQKIIKYQKELTQINKEKDSFSETYTEAKKTFQAKEKQNEKIEKVKEWLKSKNDIEAVKQWYFEEKAKSEQKRLLSEFVTHLKNHSLLSSFENSEWLKDYENALDEYDNSVNDFENKIKALKALSVFTNLDDPRSLAGWARTNLKFPLSNETESVLVHFQIFPRELNEESVKRYLPYPKELFDNLDIKNKSDKGFWINLDGVYEFIEYVPVQYLNTDKPENLVELLQQLKEGVKGDLNKAVKEKNEIVNLRKVLFSFPNLEKAIPLYSDRANIQQLNPHSISEFTERYFFDHLNTYKEKERFINEFLEAEKIYKDILKKELTIESGIKSLTDKIKEGQTYLNENYPGENPDDLILRKEKQVQEFQSSLEEIESSHRYNAFKIQKIKDALLLYNCNLLRVTQLKAEKAETFSDLKINKEQAERDLNQAKSKLEEAKREYFIAFNNHFDFNTITDTLKVDPDEGDNSLKSQYEKARISFEAKYELAIEDLEDKAQLEGGYSIGILAHKLLPTVFESSRIDENLISQHIAERLAKLTRDIQEIGSRKVEILKRVFTEVHKTYNEYLEKINGIDTYLKSKERGITGGNRASLRHTKSTDYPDKWMAPFRKQLDELLYRDGLFASLVKEVDINEIMMKAFRAAGGSIKVTPEDLLNPKSYFDLEFDLKLDSGESNAGSAGQTYTANALLGLARLSLIEDPKRKGIRIMPIDEAEGLGSNYNMLHKLAKREKYQVVSMSIETAGEIEDGEQYIYIMNENNISDGDSYVPPLGIFSDNKITEDISISDQPDPVINE